MGIFVSDQHRSSVLSSLGI